MSVRTKKKPDEDVGLDVFHIDEKIRKQLQTEAMKIDDYKEELHKINKRLEGTYSKSEIQSLENEKFQLEEKIHAIENDIPIAEYVCLANPILEQYKKLIQTPIKIDFFKSQKIQNDNSEKEKQEIIEQFLDIAKKYVAIRTYKKEKSEKYSCHCGNVSRFIEQQNKIICYDCSSVYDIQSVQTSFKDIDRVNLSQKYKYKKKVHFRDTINQYQGKQNKKITPRIFQVLAEQFELHNLVNKEGKTNTEKYANITREQIYMFLFQTDNSNYYEDINMLHHHFTGIPYPDLSSVEHLLYEDFDKVVDVYESLENVNKIHFLNEQYILYQLLRRRKFKVSESDFDILKTRERLVEHDEIYKEICAKLEWTFTPTI